MIQVSLPDEMVEQLQAVADREGSELADVLAEAVEQYVARTAPHCGPADEIDTTEATASTLIAQSDNTYWLEQERKIAIEQQAYEEQHPRILAQYRGHYIAMHRGEIVDSDVDDRALSRRIRLRYGNTPVLITPVLDEPVQTFHVRSPRLVRE